MMLVAMPTLLDPNFRQAVVLLCEHGDGGALGLVLNRPTTVSLSKVHPEAGRLVGREETIYVGGPVQTDAMMILYQGEPAPNAHPVLEGVRLTGDLQRLDRLDRILDSERRIRFYQGYAGWAPGQLEMELSAGGWKLMPGDASIVFQPDMLRIWPRLIRSLGEEWSAYAEMPPDPRLN